MLSRGVEPKITVFGDVRFEDGPLEMTALEEDPGLRDVLAHLGEAGSLWRPTEGDVATLRTTGAQLSDDDIFERDAKRQLERALAYADTLSQTFDVVVTNPPYMGSSRFNAWMSRWIRRNYPDVKGDFCTCFIERSMGLLSAQGYGALSTSNVWMFLTSYEKLRNKLIDNFDIATLVQLSVHGFKGIAAQVMAFVFRRGYTGERGAYIRLNDFDHHSLQESKTLEAIQNPDCGWFYRADASRFHEIPGSPIAYWASDAVFDAFNRGVALSRIAKPRQGLATADDARFLRLWWEVSSSNTKVDSPNAVCAANSRKKWFPFNKGGSFRKWYGNNNYLVNWMDDGVELRGFSRSVVRNADTYFMPSVTWTNVSSGKICARYSPAGSLYGNRGPSLFAPQNQLLTIQGVLNSSVMNGPASILSPSLTFEVGQVALYPILEDEDKTVEIANLVRDLRSDSQVDWDSKETSWGYRRSSMV